MLIQPHYPILKYRQTVFATFFYRIFEFPHVTREMGPLQIEDLVPEFPEITRIAHTWKRLDSRLDEVQIAIADGEVRRLTVAANEYRLN